MSTKFKKLPYTTLRAKLSDRLSGAFPGITIEFGHSERWDRPTLTVRWDGFADLLPEERFHRVLQVIGEQFFAKHLKGLALLELAGDESVDDYLKLPRSADVDPRDPALLRRLARVRFAAALARALGTQPPESCRGDFSVTRRILKTKRFSDTALRKTLLMLMRNEAFCDCAAHDACRRLTSETR